MADPNSNEIIRLLRLIVGVEGAGDATRAMGQVETSSQKAQKRMDQLNASAINAGKGFLALSKTVGVAVGNLVAVQRGVQEAFQGLGFRSFQVDLANYSRTLLASRVQFAKYGESIVGTERRLLSLKDSFAFSRQEIAGLQSQFEKGFAFQAPERMVNVFDTLRDVVGENVDAMSNLQGSVQQVGNKVPIYQELFSYGVANRSEQIAKNARNMSRALLAASAIAGDISLDEFKEQLGVMAQLDKARESGDDSAEAKAARERTKQLENNVRTLNELKVLWEDIQMTLAQELQPALSNINNLLQSGGEKLENIAVWSLKAAAAAKVIGGISLGMGLSQLLNPRSNILSMLAAPGSRLDRGQTGVGRTRIGGGLGGMAMGGNSPANPLYVIVLNPTGLGANVPLGRQGAAGAAGTLGRGAKLKAAAATASRYILPVAMVAGVAQASSSVTKSQFTNPEGQLEGEGTLGSAATIAAGGASGAVLGTMLLPGFGTVVGGAIGATVSVLNLLATELETTSKSIKASNKSYIEAMKSFSDNALTEGEKDLANLMLKRNELLASFDKEKSEDASIGSAIFGNALWFGADTKELEAIQDELDIINKSIAKQKREIDEAKDGMSDQTDTLSATDKVLIGFVARYQLLNSFIELSNRRFDASLSKLDAVSSLISSMGGYEPLSAGLDFGDSLEEAMTAQQRQRKVLDQARSALAEYKELASTLNMDSVEGTDEFLAQMEQSFKAIPNIGEVLSNEIMEKLALRGSEVQIDDLFAETTAKLDTAAVKSREALKDIIQTGAKRFEGEKELAASLSNRIAAEVELATNLAAGVAPSAEMRMEQVRAIQSEIVAIEKSLSFYQQVKAVAEKLIKQGLESGNEAQVEEGLIARKTAEQSINELVAERTQMMAKQASITKVIRDGYISAIAAMSTGAGMFTQIIIDQNKNLGQLQAATDNKVVSLRSGAFARGLTTSERFTAGGIMSEGNRFGASDEVNKLITESNPLGAFFDVKDDMKDGISSTGARIVEVWQQEAGQFFSTMSESMRSQPYGTSELQDHITETGGKPATIGNPSSPIPVEARNKGGILGGRSYGPNRDSILVYGTPGEGIITREAVAQNGGKEFIDSINSGKLSVSDSQRSVFAAKSGGMFGKLINPAGVMEARGGSTEIEELTADNMRSRSIERQRYEDENFNRIKEDMESSSIERQRYEDEKFRRIKEEIKFNEYETMSKRLDEANLIGAEDIKSSFLSKYPNLWHEKLHKDEQFYDLYNITKDASESGRKIDAGEYEELNSRYMKAQTRLSNLRYLLPSPGIPQQEISKLQKSVEQQYFTIVNDKDIVSEEMKNYGTISSPVSNQLLSNKRIDGTKEENVKEESPREGSVKAQKPYRQEVRSPLQEGIDDALDFKSRMNDLNDKPLGVKVPDAITDLMSYDGPVKTLSEIKDRGQKIDYIEWKDKIEQESDNWTLKMKSRIQTSQDAQEKKYGRKQLIAWREVTSEMIKRGKPYSPEEDPNFIGPRQPAIEERLTAPAAPRVPVAINDADATQSYDEMQKELDRRKQIITNRMISWSREQSVVIMEQLAAAESIPAKTAIVAQLEDFDMNSQKVYERLEEARHPAQIAEMLPQLRALGVDGIDDSVFEIKTAPRSAIGNDQSSSGDTSNPYTNVVRKAIDSEDPVKFLTDVVKRPLSVPPQFSYDIGSGEGGLYRISQTPFDSNKYPQPIDAAAVNQSFADMVIMPENSDSEIAHKYINISNLMKNILDSTYSDIEMPSNERSSKIPSTISSVLELIRDTQSLETANVNNNYDKEIVDKHNKIMEHLHLDSAGDTEQSVRRTTYNEMESIYNRALDKKNSIYEKVQNIIGFEFGAKKYEEMDEARKELARKEETAKKERDVHLGTVMAGTGAGYRPNTAISSPGKSKAAVTYPLVKEEAFSSDFYSVFGDGKSEEEKKKIEEERVRIAEVNRNFQELTKKRELIPMVEKAYNMTSELGHSVNRPWPGDSIYSSTVMQSYATGGIAQPRAGGLLARIAEAGKPEAVVPLPDGRSIPVMFQNDSNAVSSRPETIMDSINSGVNGYMDSPEASMTQGSSKVEIVLSSQDKRRIIDGLVSELGTMMQSVLEKSEEQILNDMRVRW